MNCVTSSIELRKYNAKWTHPTNWHQIWVLLTGFWKSSFHQCTCRNDAMFYSLLLFNFNVLYSAMLAVPSQKAKYILCTKKWEQALLFDKLNSLVKLLHTFFGVGMKGCTADTSPLLLTTGIASSPTHSIFLLQITYCKGFARSSKTPESREPNQDI